MKSHNMNNNVNNNSNQDGIQFLGTIKGMPTLPPAASNHYTPENVVSAGSYLNVGSNNVVRGYVSNPNPTEGNVFAVGTTPVHHRVTPVSHVGTARPKGGDDYHTMRIAWVPTVEQYIGKNHPFCMFVTFGPCCVG